MVGLHMVIREMHTYLWGCVKRRYEALKLYVFYSKKITLFALFRMNVRCFYENIKTTVAEKQNYIEEQINSRNVVNVVVLPPEAGDRGDQESDKEEVPEDKEKEYEPAGQLEIKENDADEEKEPNSPLSKRQSNVSQNWVKTSEFNKPIESCELSLSQTLVNEFDCSAFEI